VTDEAKVWHGRFGGLSWRCPKGLFDSKISKEKLRKRNVIL
jgi:hypothetical protein